VPLPIHANFDRTNALPLFGSPNNPALPPWLSDLILKALHKTYVHHSPSSMPNLDAAYAQLIHHWRLLHSFDPLPQSAPIATVLRLRMNTTLTPRDYDRPDPPGGPGGPGSGPAPGPAGNIFDPGPGAPPWFRPSHNDVGSVIGEICEDILFAPLFLIRLGFYIGNKSKKPTTTGQSRSALSTPLTPAEFNATMGGKDILIAIDQLFCLDDAVQRLVIDCMRLLKYIGLLYAEPKELHNPEFAQCLVLPPASLVFQWPTRPLINPDLILDLPTSPLEKPAHVPSGFAPGEKPIAFIVPGIGTGAAMLGAGFDMVKQELLELATSPIRVANLDLDADRGDNHLCWEPKPGTSINDEPVSVNVLGYGAV
jgi:hypothetical protein